MEQRERISAREADLAAAEAAVQQMESALDALEAALPRLRALNAYLGSPEWYADRAADESGAFPPTLRRGVLTEDAIYDLLTDYRALREQVRSLPEEL